MLVTAAYFVILGGEEKKTVCACLGTLVGILAAAFPRKGQGRQAKDLAWRQLPFAPFFAVPALLWVVAGNWFYWAVLPFLP